MIIMKRFVKLYLIILVACMFTSRVYANTSYHVGEKITYDIKKLVKAGEATLEFKGPTRYNGTDTVLIVFTARAPKFYDEEKIYLNPETFLPMFVERDLNIFGSIEKITETYNQTKGEITIAKTVGEKTETQTIAKDGPIENIYGFMFRHRENGDFTVGETSNIQLPTKNVELVLKEKTNIKAGQKKYEASLIESTDREYRMWFDESEKRIPLRIDGALGFGSTAMIMRSID